MQKQALAVVALVSLLGVGACNKGADKDDTTNTKADTTTIKGVDSVGNAAVPTTDTVVKTTTTDTIQGEASDSAKARADSLKKKAEKKKS